MDLSIQTFLLALRSLRLALCIVQTLYDVYVCCGISVRVCSVCVCHCVCVTVCTCVCVCVCVCVCICVFVCMWEREGESERERERSKIRVSFCMLCRTIIRIYTSLPGEKDREWIESQQCSIFISFVQLSGEHQVWEDGLWGRLYTLPSEHDQWCGEENPSWPPASGSKQLPKCCKLVWVITCQPGLEMIHVLCLWNWPGYCSGPVSQYLHLALTTFQIKFKIYPYCVWFIPEIH